jgi:hypothetical protein
LGMMISSCKTVVILMIHGYDSPPERLSSSLIRLLKNVIRPVSHTTELLLVAS